MSRTTRTALGMVIIAALLIMSPPRAIAGEPGEQVEPYGAGFAGGATYEGPYTSTEPLDVVALAGGSSIVVAEGDQGRTMVKLTPLGRPDATFGGGDGEVPLVGASEPGQRAHVAVAPNGEIVVAQDGSINGRTLRIDRYSTAGDRLAGRSFFEAKNRGLDDLALDTQGRAITVQYGSGAFVVRRFATGGLPDTSFSGDGEFSLSAPPPLLGLLAGSIMVRASVMLAGDEPVVAGRAPEAGAAPYVFKLTSAGSLNTAFGTNGVSRPSLPRAADTMVLDIAQTASGDIVLVGAACTGLVSCANTSAPTLLVAGTMSPFAARLDRAGRLDGTFGAGGVVTLRTPGHLPAAVATDVAPDGGDDVFIGVRECNVSLTGGTAFGFHLRDAGVPDTRFGPDGRAELSDACSGNNIDTPVVSASSNRIFAASQAVPDGQNASFAVAAFEDDPPVIPPPSSEYVPLSPSRILDTRSGVGRAGVAPVGQGGVVGLGVTGVGGVPASGVSAVVLNVTVTQPTASGFVTVWPAGEAQPLASNLNFVAGQSVPNLVIAKVGAGGVVNLFNSDGTTHLIADVVGYFPS